MGNHDRRAFCAGLGLAATGLLTGTRRAAAAVAPVRVGVAGLSHSHVHGLLGRAARGDVQVVGIAETNRALAERYAKRHGFALDLVTGSLEAMLERARPEVVCAFGPILDHLAVVETCAPRGIHVMVEKPLAVSLEAARRMARLAEQHKVLLLTNYETTWYGSNRRLRELVAAGALGAIRKLVVHDGHAGPVAIGVEPEFLEWLRDPVRNGAGALMDFGCYGADLMTWLMAGQRPLSVTAVTQQLQPKLYPRVDDEATIVVAYKEAQGIIQASWNWPYGRKDTHVYGERGYVLALDGRRLQARLGDAPEALQEAPPPPAPYDEPFAYLAAAVRREIEPRGDEPSGLLTNLVAMEILDAARESARSGRTVTLAASPPA
jgi:predicted dehydrogenase